MSRVIPLYDDLLSLVQDDLSLDQRRVCAAINGLPDEHLSIIYMLVLHHASLNGTTPAAYGATTFKIGKGVLMNMNMLPPVLQCIIAIYLSSISI